jgi:hypothetical protein
MITVECPYCGRKHILSPDEIELLARAGKLVIADCQCETMYTIEQDDNCYFIKHSHHGAK